MIAGAVSLFTPRFSGHRRLARPCPHIPSAIGAQNDLRGR